MDYKKEYEQALDNFKKIKAANKDNKELVDFIEYKYPELKESEDEKIRKELKRYFDTEISDYGNVEWRSGIYYGEIIAWLEKQDNNWNNAHDFRPKHLQKCLCYDTYMSGVYCYVYDDIDKYWCTQTTEEHDPDGDNHVCDYADYRVTMWMPIPSTPSYSSKKQGEQKSVDKVKPKFKVGDVIRLKGGAAEYTIRRVTNTKYYTDGWSYDIERCHEEYELVEQKSDDNKVELKFKVGDWIVNNNGEPKVYKVEELGWPDSIISNSLGNQYINTFTLEKHYHLWTIKDAKEGDVLSFSDKTIVIFKDLYNATTFHSYCHIEYDTFGISKDGMPDWWNSKGFHPATKEQRDILFQKMKEARYEWDTDNKKLKEIEQTSTNKVEPKFKVGDTIVEKDFDEIGCGTIVNIKDGKYIFDDGCYIEIKEQGLWQLVEQKPTEKVEPKFKVGDWVIYECEEYSVTLQIKNTIYGTYEFTDNSTLNVVDENTLRLWTIKDAKDGDILATKDTIFIFKHMDKTGLSLCRSYCEVISDCKLGLGFDFPINSVYPATKEQRDFLFQKMKDAGYEWDAEKKELRKIEQKCDEDCCKISDDITTEEKDMNEYNKGFECGKQRVLKYPEDFNLCEQSASTWSEEDENRFINLIHLVECSDEGKGTKEGFVNFINRLKSLK